MGRRARAGFDIAFSRSTFLPDLIVSTTLRCRNARRSTEPFGKPVTET